jgi:hypothetical protein
VDRIRSGRHSAALFHQGDHQLGIVRQSASMLG